MRIIVLLVMNLKSVLILFVLSLFLSNCQKEETTLIDEQQDEAFTEDDVFKSLMLSITSHYAAFDDMIDKSSCFSIDFPYACYVNGYYVEYQEEEDLYFLEEDDVIELVFPINLTFSNYDTATITSAEALTTFRNQCATGALYDQSVACIDAVYPMTMALFHEDTSVFETVSIDNDREMFLYLQDLNWRSRASMNYPVYVQVNNGEFIQILNNQEFKTVVQDNIPLCK
ncbi:MAG: hypothetical protein ABJM06_03745 [Gilvibacter sp.]